MKISVQADRIKIWLNDQLVLEARDMESITAGQLGLLTHADTVALFDDLHISDIPSRSDATMPTAAAQSGPAADKNIRTLGQRTLDFKP